MLGLKVNAILEREPVAEPIASDLGEVRQLAVHTSEAVREAIFALSLPRPAASGLLFEMRRLVRELGQSEDLEADLVVSGKPLRLGGQAEQTLYILAREALANVVRHARARRVLVSLRYSDHHVDLVIQDDGAGASDQILQHYQESGTHFGMKRSRRQVEDLGGTFDVRNGEESGLAIRVRIPVIVDDHEMVREGLMSMLSSEPDFEVVGQTGFGEVVAELVETSRPDVVLLDARLPDISGVEVCRRLGRTHPGVAVVILTTYTDIELVEECLQAGARGYVVKDVERFSLKESIRAVSRGQAVLAPQVAGHVIDRIRSRQAGERRPAGLNASQVAILRLISRGHSNREIAADVHLSENTVKTHVQEIFRKLGVRNRVEAAILAGKSGWI